MPTDENLRLPPAPVTLYPRRCFPPVQRRRHAALGDPLLTQIAHALTPHGPRPRSHRRSRVGPPYRKRTLRAATRTWTDLLGVWRACDQPTCRDQYRCCGNPFACLPHHLPAVSQPARLWFATIGLALERNTTFAEALAAAEDRDAQALCERWRSVVTQVLNAPPNTTRE